MWGRDDDRDPRDNYAGLLPRRPRHLPVAAPLTPAGRAAGIATFAMLGALFWTLWSPWPDLAVPIQIAAAPGALAVAARWPALFTLGGRDAADSRVGLGAFIGLGVAGLAAAAWRRSEHFVWDTPAYVMLGLILALAALLTLMAALIDRRQLRDGLALLFVAAISLGWCAAVLREANARIGVVTLATYPAVVTDKDVRSRGRGPNRYDLSLAMLRTGSRTRFTASSTVYGQFAVGDAACIREKRGGLGVRWTPLEAC